jgi:acid phosphatase type 7
MRGTTRRAAVDVGVLAIAVVIAVVLVILANSASQPGGSPPPSARASSGVLGTPRTSPATDAVAVLVGAGDIAHCERNEDGLTADAVEKIPGIVFTLGDHAYPDASSDDFENCYGSTWGRPSIKERTRPTIGDDDYETGGAAPYFEYFGAAAGEAPGGYYAYDAGAWRVYVLNSHCRLIGGCGEGSAQDIWLQADLEANRRDCVIAMWHEPYFTSDPGGNSDSMRHVWRILYEAGAELILNADHHVYERFSPQAPSGEPDPETGVVQMIVGTGGGSPEAFGDPLPNSVVRASRVFGVLRLDLSPDSYTFEFIDVAGPDLADKGERECHQAPVIPAEE